MTAEDHGRLSNRWRRETATLVKDLKSINNASSAVEKFKLSTHNSGRPQLCSFSVTTFEIGIFYRRNFTWYLWKHLTNSATVKLGPETDWKTIVLAFDWSYPNISRCDWSGEFVVFNVIKKAVRKINSVAIKNLKRNIKMFWFIVPFHFFAAHTSFHFSLITCSKFCRCDVNVTFGHSYEPYSDWPLFQ